jgi:predicted nucleotidyltransferase
MDRLERFRARHLPGLVERWRPSEVLLFGSWARGENLLESDLDLVVVSDRFEGIPWVERAARVAKDLRLYEAADLLCYTPEEFARKRREYGIVRVAAEEGRSLLA